MDYIAQAWIGKDAADARIAKVFDSTADLPGVSSFDLCRKYIFEQLETSDYAAMRFVPEMEHVKSFEYGAFTHPVRGRCMFEAVQGEWEKAKHEMEEDAAVPIYSPNELYKMTPVSVEEDVSYRLFDHWFSEHNIHLDDNADDAVDATKRIQMRYLAHIGMGFDESWELATLWWRPCGASPFYEPVAVLTYQGDDYDYEKYVTDPKALTELIRFVTEFTPKASVDPDKPMECYTEFWRHTLHDFYDVTTGKPKRPRATGPKNKWGNTPTEWWHHGINREETEYAEEEKK